jgi:hypothetical protein
LSFESKFQGVDFDVVITLAYGKGNNKDREKRMADLGRSSISANFVKLRQLVISACGIMADSIWPESITDDLPDANQIDAAMLAAQAKLKGVLNSVWAEKARLMAKSAVLQQVRRARNNLFGRFKHLSTVGDTPLPDGMPRLVNFPEEWSSRLSAADVAAMQAVADSMDYAGAINLFQRLESGKAVTGLTKLQWDALLGMLSLVKERFNKPQWDSTDATVQLHLDYRCLPGGRATQTALLDGLTNAAKRLLETEDKMPVTNSFLVSGVVARGTPLKLTATVRAEVVNRLLEPVAKDSEVSFTSLVLEIGPHEVTIKGVISHQPKMLSLDQVEHLVGLDFGYFNTAAAVAVKNDGKLDAEWLEDTADWSKAKAKAYLETHCHDGEAVKQMLFKGRNFLDAIAGHCAHINKLRSEIDRLYNRLGRLKHEINCLLGQPDVALVDLEMAPGNDQRLNCLVQRFAKLLATVGKLKLLRRMVYRSIDGLKKSWFGWVTTQVVGLCRKLKAAYVREDLTVIAAEKDKPEYKGRTFNKMINNGSKGQFTRRASAKLKWYGIPEFKVPSYYTSSTDVRYGVVDKSQRIGEVFTAKHDGRQWHADVHAALTLALWPILKAKPSLGLATQELL